MEFPVCDCNSADNAMEVVFREEFQYLQVAFTRDIDDDGSLYGNDTHNTGQFPDDGIFLLSHSAGHAYESLSEAFGTRRPRGDPLACCAVAEGLHWHRRVHCLVRCP